MYRLQLIYQASNEYRMPHSSSRVSGYRTASQTYCPDMAIVSKGGEVGRQSNIKANLRRLPYIFQEAPRSFHSWWTRYPTFNAIVWSFPVSSHITTPTCKHIPTYIVYSLKTDCSITWTASRTLRSTFDIPTSASAASLPGPLSQARRQYTRPTRADLHLCTRTRCSLTHAFLSQHRFPSVIALPPPWTRHNVLSPGSLSRPPVRSSTLPRRHRRGATTTATPSSCSQTTLCSSIRHHTAQTS